MIGTLNFAQRNTKFLLPSALGRFIGFHLNVKLDTISVDTMSVCRLPEHSIGYKLNNIQT